YDLRLNFVTAALGGKVEVPTLNGTTMVKIPEGTQHDHILRLKGLGAPGLKSQTRGDQLIRTKIEIPTSLTAKQRELLHAYAEESGIAIDTQGEGLFDKVKNLFE